MADQKELLALIERYAAEREEAALERHCYPGKSWMDKQEVADATLAQIKAALGAPSREAPNGEAEFQVWMEDDVFCADAMGPREQALTEARRYAMQYAQDGPVRIEEITRRVVERIAADGVTASVTQPTGEVLREGVDYEARHTTQCKHYDNNCGAVHPSNCPDCPFRTAGVPGAAMLELLWYVYAASAVIVLATSLYIFRHDGSAHRTPASEVFEPALIPGINTVIAACCLWIVADDWRRAHGVTEVPRG